MRVAIFSMPHNFRDELYDENGPGAGPSFCHYACDEPRRPSPLGSEWVTLLIRMPACLFTFTDPDGRVIAATADGKRIRWTNLDIVVKGSRSSIPTSLQMTSTEIRRV